jgi:hypothetical protein
MATTLTTDQAAELAHSLLESADAIDRRIVAEWTTLDPATRGNLMSQAQGMRAQSAEIANVAVGMVLDDAGDAFGQIASATLEGKAALERIQSIDRIIAIAAALVRLGAAVAKKNLGESLNAAGALFGEIA